MMLTMTSEKVELRVEASIDPKAKANENLIAPYEFESQSQKNCS